MNWVDGTRPQSLHVFASTRDRRFSRLVAAGLALIAGTGLMLFATPIRKHTARWMYAPARPAVERVDSVRVPILVYHSVAPHHPGQTAEQRLLDVDDSVFALQMRYIVDNGYRVIPFGTLVDALNGRVPAPERAVVLTFDDGWENQYHYAFPILKQLDLTATFFVFTDPIGRERGFMTWDQLRDMKTAGMTIGSHSRTHPQLTDTHSSLRDELVTSRAAVEKEVGSAPDFFAYPYGDWNNRVTAAVKSAGYRAARTATGGAKNTPSDLYHLRAIVVTDDMPAFTRALQGR